VLEIIRDTIRKIPKGKVSTYGDVARAAGFPGCARQVVWALRGASRGLPWHRVVGAKGKISLPGENGLEQRFRLESEGVVLPRIARVDGKASTRIRRPPRLYPENMPLPRMLPVRQHFPDRSLPDVRGEVLRQLSARQFASRVHSGARIAIGVGSRGISNIATITRAAVDYWKSQGCAPVHLSRHGQPRRRYRRRSGRRARALRHS
jgi:alkylated DNA nucleotide flippase Atl1